MSVRLYVGNLPKEVIEKEALQNLFADEEIKTVSTKIIKDRKTGKCRGFAFVTVANDEIADQFIAKFNGQSFMESELKIEKALPRQKSQEEGGEGAAAETEVQANAPATPSNKRPKKRSAKKQAAPTGNQQTSSDNVQPDPRWAADLAKLKEMLQTVNT